MKNLEKINLDIKEYWRNYWDCTQTNCQNLKQKEVAVDDELVLIFQNLINFRMIRVDWLAVNITWLFKKGKKEKKIHLKINVGWLSLGTIGRKMLESFTNGCGNSNLQNHKIIRKYQCRSMNRKLYLINMFYVVIRTDIKMKKIVNSCIINMNKRNIFNMQLMEYHKNYWLDLSYP